MRSKKQPRELLLKGGTVVDPFRKEKYVGDVFIKNGKIQKVGDVNYKSSMTQVDCSGLIVTHGFCDIHVHFREPGREDKESLATGSQAALAGGFTRVCVMPNTNPPLDTPESIRFIVEKAEILPIHIHPIGSITKGQKGKKICEMAAMRNEGAVAFSDDGIPVSDGEIMRLALEYAGMIRVPIINHAEDCFIRKNGVMNEGEISTRMGLTGNPDIAESTMVNRDLELAKLAGSVLHVPHVSTAKAMNHIRRMKKEYKHLSAEVTPHHLYFNDEALVEYDTNLKVAPPIRTEHDRRALIKALKDDVIDCIATDHAPHTIEEKERTFDLAPFGMIGLESCFGVVYQTLVKESGMALGELIPKLTVNPRVVMGFQPDLFKPGIQAEISVIDTEKEWVFKKSSIQSRSGNSPFLGKKLTGKIQFILSKGIITEIT